MIALLRPVPVLVAVAAGISLGGLAQTTRAARPRAGGTSPAPRRLSLEEEKQLREASILSSQATILRQAGRRAQAKPEDLVRLLTPDTAVVELFRATVWNRPGDRPGKVVREQHYDAFVLRRGEGPEGTKVSWVKLGPARPIDEAVAPWRSGITARRPGPAIAVPAERRLREALWDKIEPNLACCTAVIVVPDSLLCFLPWVALPGRKPGTCLIEDYTIATAPSAQQLYAMLTEPQTAGGKLPIEALREAQLTIYRNPDSIPPLATTRGPDFQQVIKSIPREKSLPEGKTAPPRLWAGFILSGRGQ
jgi:hypothetical protein